MTGTTCTGCSTPSQASLDALRTTSGFVDAVPNTLLFLLARHALILGYAESSWRLHDFVGYDAGDRAGAASRNRAFVHVAGAAAERVAVRPAVPQRPAHLARAGLEHRGADHATCCAPTRAPASSATRSRRSSCWRTLRRRGWSGRWSSTSTPSPTASTRGASASSTCSWR